MKKALLVPILLSYSVNAVPLTAPFLQQIQNAVAVPSGIIASNRTRYDQANNTANRERYRMYVVNSCNFVQNNMDRYNEDRLEVPASCRARLTELDTANVALTAAKLVKEQAYANSRAYDVGEPGAAFFPWLNNYLVDRNNRNAIFLTQSNTFRVQEAAIDNQINIRVGNINTEGSTLNTKFEICARAMGAIVPYLPEDMENCMIVAPVGAPHKAAADAYQNSVTRIENWRAQINQLLLLKFHAKLKKDFLFRQHQNNRTFVEVFNLYRATGTGRIELNNEKAAAQQAFTAASNAITGTTAAPGPGPRVVNLKNTINQLDNSIWNSGNSCEDQPSYAIPSTCNLPEFN